MSARTTRTRLLAAAAVTAAALALGACSDEDGAQDGTRDEGASAAATETTNEGEATGGGQAGGQEADSASLSEGAAGSSGSSGSTGSTGSTGSEDSGSGGGDTGSSSRNDQCDGSNTETTVSEVSRPLNHLLITVTNTGAETCDLLDYPMLRFEGAQSVPPVFEDSRPQAVVTLAPGESGYAGVLLSSADGSGSNPHTAESLEIFFGSDNDASANPPLPEGGVFFDDSLTVTYWQQAMDDALLW